MNQILNSNTTDIINLPSLPEDLAGNEMPALLANLSQGDPLGIMETY